MTLKNNPKCQNVDIAHTDLNKVREVLIILNSSFTVVVDTKPLVNLNMLKL